MQFDTLRLRLIKIAARVVELKKQIKIHLPSTPPISRSLASSSTACRAWSPENPGTVPRRPTPAFNPQRLADPDKQTPLRRDRHPMPASTSCN